ncbi:MAG: amino acid ABC transporter permease [Firmicutes bacterium]|nr:amino acid ABC transporter permease [Bacillota bacterium]
MWQDFWPRMWQTIVENGGFLLSAFYTTMLITFLSFVFGLVVGTVLAILRTNPSEGKFAKIGRSVSSAYVMLMRGIPDVVLLLLLFFVFLAHLSINPVLIAALGIGMTASSYISEILRAAILSIDRGQMEAAVDLGATRMKAMQRVILPQAYKRAIPQLGNHLIIIAKSTSIVGFIAVVDLTRAVGQIVARTFDAIVPYILLAMIYMVIVYFLVLLIKFFEVKIFKTRRVL